MMNYRMLLIPQLKIQKGFYKKYYDLKWAHLKLLKGFETVVSEKNYFEEKIKQMKEVQYLPSLITENKALKAKINCLIYDLSRFFQGQENLDLMLCIQKILWIKQVWDMIIKEKLLIMFSSKLNLLKDKKHVMLVVRKGISLISVIIKPKRLQSREFGFLRAQQCNQLIFRGPK